MNDQFANGNDPVSRRKAAQRSSAQAVVRSANAPPATPPKPSVPEGTGEGDVGQLPAGDPSVMYMGPEAGPFACSNCRFFVADGQPCEKVSDPVAGDGCCNLFESVGQNSDQNSAPPMPSAPGAPPSGESNVQSAY